MLVVAALMSGYVVLELWRLPGIAERNGSGTGASWASARIASVIASALLPLLLAGAWRLAVTAPRLAASGPTAMATVALLCRGLAARGAPDDFSMVDDRRLWILYLGVSVFVTLGLATYAAVALRRARASSAAGETA